ncbi:GH3 auxin-responsive promoter [Corchorus olitorius]|uniref:GH3 auxin-responsive promoter n=1 Tax=Corchorus olitorius TaxID=93759 RepID=A0A1R3HSC3_9ROSI|nr:GH3 auxin-responsive promoter [Corchorus olitorius]
MALIIVEPNDYEANLKTLEDLTTNAHQVQDKLLEDILKRNAGSEYLRGFFNGCQVIDKKLFKKNVPIVTYEDIKPYIDRIVNGKPSSILLAEPVTGFLRSTGTSGGQPKMIPSTAERMEKSILFLTLAASVIKRHVDDLNHGKTLYFLSAKPEIQTPSGLTANSVSTNYFKTSIFRKTLSQIHTTPIETVFCPDTKQSMYCQLLVGLLQRDQVVSVGSSFASVVVRAIKLLEDYWKELCFNIKTGQISDWIKDSGCRNAVSLILKPNPKLADSINHICNCESWEGIIKKLWPQAKLIEAVATGAMSQYTRTLDFYSNGLPIVSPGYVCTEAACGINLEPLTKPSDVSYTFIPNMAYFEFIPVNQNCSNVEPVDLVDVKLGQCYEVVVTTSTGLYRYRIGDVLMATGFYNNAPQFQFVERRNAILSIDADKTSESDLLMAVTEAKILLDPIGFILTGYTSYADTSSTPGHYVIFWEVKANEGNGVKELDPKVMVECCSRMEESLSYIYKSYRKENAIAALEIRVVKHGTFDALMDYYVSQGTSMNQYKTPSCIKSKEALKILDSRVVGKFFSPKIDF